MNVALDSLLVEVDKLQLSRRSKEKIVNALNGLRETSAMDYNKLDLLDFSGRKASYKLGLLFTEEGKETTVEPFKKRSTEEVETIVKNSNVSFSIASFVAMKQIKMFTIGIISMAEKNNNKVSTAVSNRFTGGTPSYTARGFDGMFVMDVCEHYEATVAREYELHNEFSHHPKWDTQVHNVRGRVPNDKNVKGLLYLAYVLETSQGESQLDISEVVDLMENSFVEEPEDIQNVIDTSIPDEEASRCVIF